MGGFVNVCSRYWKVGVAMATDSFFGGGFGAGDVLGAATGLADSFLKADVQKTAIKGQTKVEVAKAGASAEIAKANATGQLASAKEKAAAFAESARAKEAGSTKTLAIVGGGIVLAVGTAVAAATIFK